ncbi:uncharacterized protein LOC113032850 [Astatotilapia calliptera]|uniref:uncharacterized protein LOC113032850 n=1 Tax=Astatotilapia calliptera TaxID=8154 RepID=UPI000E3FA81B|nr:uncharacterized protein LOC113032850 [Astatotilapia calliptera]
MVETYRGESVEETRKALMKMNRTDLVQRLSDKQFPPLSQRVEMMELFIELLLETLADLRGSERKDFIKILKKKYFLLIPLSLFEMSDLQHTVFLMVQTYGRQSVQKIVEVLKEMKRTDLAQRLTDSSSEAQNKHLDEHLCALIHKVATMVAVKDLLVETLEDLSDQDLMKFKTFLQFTRFQKSLPQIKLNDDRRGIVNEMIDKLGDQSVEVIREVLTDMQRTDLVQRLSESSSGLKEKHSEDERWPALIHKVETMESVIELLLETLDGLNEPELSEFNQSLREIHHDKYYSVFSWMPYGGTDLQDTVFLMVQTYGQQSVENTMEVLKKMKRTDLAQRLSDCSSEARKKHSVDERRSALIHKVATMAAVKHLHLEYLNNLNNNELQDFQRFLRSLFHLRNLLYSSTWLNKLSTRADIVNLVVDELGLQSVEVIRDFFMYMNRTDLVQKLPESSSASREKHSVDEHGAALWKREVATTAVRNILVEILRHLNQKDLEEFNLLLQFTCFKMGLPQIQIYTNMTDELVKQMVDKWGHQSVEVIREVLTDMQRTDLVQRLSESSSGLKAAGSSAEGFDVEETEKEKHSEDERWPALIHKVETMESVIELLLEALDGLNEPELDKFNWTLRQIHLHKYYSDFTWMWYMMSDLQDTVFLIVQTYGQQSVEKTMEVLKEMKRTDLAQRLSDCSSLPRKKHSVDERRSALIHKVATMAVVKYLLFETLNDLSDEELKKFKRLLQMIYPSRTISHFSFFSPPSTRADVVNLVVEEFGQQSVDVTRDFFMYMNRTDLVQKLPESSSASREKHSVDEHGAALLKREKELEAVRQILLETLNEFSKKDLGKFILLLPFTCFKMSLPQIQMYTNRTEDLVDLMVDELGHQSVEATMEVLTDMNRPDLMLRLSESSSEKRQPSLFHTEASMTSVKEKLLETPENFSFSELEHFKRVLQQRVTKRGFQKIPASQLETADRADVVQLIVKTCSEESVEVVEVEVLTDMNRPDLMLRLSESSSGRKTERSSELEGCQSLTQDCSDWTNLEPEVNSTDADEAPTYSLQSAAGHFECRVSGLRWVCKGKTSFQYQFRSWEGHMERMESRQYMPAGPLMDVTVTAGKLNEVHLPHWICIDDIPDILDTFAVLHIDDCGDVVEKVSEVTPTHVKLTEPHFSLIGALIRLFFPLKISCYTLMYYKPNTSFLKLHVYPIRQDPALEQGIDKEESSDGYKRIKKPHPDKYLQTERTFSLKADNTSAKIQPKELTLRYNRQNFYEVYVKNPGSELILTLVHTHPADGEPADEPLWKCEIQADDHPESGQAEAAGSSVGAAAVSSQSAEENTVDKHLSAQMQKALTVHSDREKLLEMLEDLKKEELEKFKWFLRDRDVLVELQPIPESRLEKASTCDLVDLVVQTYTEKSVEVTKKVFKKINRNDLVQKLSDSSS